MENTEATQNGNNHDEKLFDVNEATDRLKKYLERSKVEVIFEEPVIIKRTIPLKYTNNPTYEKLTFAEWIFGKREPDYSAITRDIVEGK